VTPDLALIPHMLVAFMEQDQAFRRAVRPDQLRSGRTDVQEKKGMG
jgi:hypothetical protein